MLVLHQVLLMHLEILVTMEAFRICTMRPACQSVRRQLWQNTEEQHCRFRTGSLVKFSLSANVINDTVFSLSYRSVLFECFFLVTDETAEIFAVLVRVKSVRLNMETLH
jgi:hypothetical protein